MNAESSDVVSVTDYMGNAYLLTRLERHLLYCLDEGREPSRQYSTFDFLIAVRDLYLKGLVEYYWRALTPTGVNVVAKLRARHE